MGWDRGMAPLPKGGGERKGRARRMLCWAENDDDDDDEDDFLGVLVP